jgi:AbrB family looped-hinge helix DNA binding protein
MQTRVSSKGQIALPAPLRRKLGIQARHPLDIAIEHDRIVLTAHFARNRQPTRSSPKPAAID